MQQHLLTPQVLFSGKNFFEINLNEAVKLASTGSTKTSGPEAKQKLINALHLQHAKRFEADEQRADSYISYGGYGEDRSFMWADTYMAKTNSFIHLGVDINVPKSTNVTLPFDVMVIDSRTDTDLDVGWGTRLVVVPTNPEENPAIVLGHLAPDVPQVGHIIGAGTTIATIGTYPENGNVFEHLHIQLVVPELIRNNPSIWDTLDGYGTKADLTNYPDPFNSTFLLD